MLNRKESKILINTYKSQNVPVHQFCKCRGNQNVPDRLPLTMVQHIIFRGTGRAYELMKTAVTVKAKGSFRPLGEGSTTNASSITWLLLPRYNPSTLVGAISRRWEPGSLRRRRRTSSPPWLPGVGSERKKRRSQRRDRRRRVPGLSFIDPVDALLVAPGPPISHRWLKRPRGTSQAPLQSLQHALERLRDGGRAVKAESGGH
jgi:hypothetical protein